MKVYLSGRGVLSSLGNDIESMFRALIDGKSAVRARPDWREHVGLNSRLAAEVPEYDIMSIPRTARRSMSRMSEMATLATLQALTEAGLKPGEPINTPRVAMIMGSTSGSPASLETYFKKLFERGGPEGQLSTSFFKVMNHSVPANVASALDFRGALLSPSAACATSAQAMILGWELIRAGIYDVVLAGGADELHYTTSAVFDTVMAASRKYNDRPSMSPRPFDADRDGLVVSEGASVVVMESEDHAHRRGAHAIAEFCGGAYLCDGTHMSQSSAPTMSQVMRLALERSGFRPEQVDYVNAHATGTVHGDAEEAKAIASVFENRVPVSSLKAHFGHSLAACGTLEVIACTEMMRRGVLIPTLNLEQVDPACGGLKHLTRVEKGQPQRILSNNFAFGGMSTSLVISALREGAFS